MENITTSPIQNINNLIQNYNPFRNMGIVTAQNIWKQEVPDLSTFNKHASDKVFEAINKVKTAQNRDEKITSLVLTAQFGVGKTHILSRIRHQLEHHGGGFFVYGSADTFDLDLIKYQLQQTITESLSYTGSQGVMQWQEVAAAMFNEAAKAQNPKAKNHEAKQIVDQFDKIHSKNPKLMEQIIKYFSKIKNNIDPYIVKAMLWTLSENYAPFAVKWLSGEELDLTTAQNMGLPTNANKTKDDKEKDALNTILKVVNLVSCYNPIVICFDQLEIQKVNDLGLTPPLIIADLVSSLFNNLETEIFGQGVVILTVMFPDTWENILEQPGTGGLALRVCKYTGKKAIELKYIDQNSIVDMVSLWLKNKLYTPHNLIPPTPFYPFTEEQLINYGKSKPTVRELLEWCTNNFKVDINQKPSITIKERFDIALTEEKELFYQDDLNNDIDLDLSLANNEDNNDDLDLSTLFSDSIEETGEEIGNNHLKIVDEQIETTTQVQIPKKIIRESQNKQKPARNDNNYTNKGITAFTFNGRRHKVKLWTELLIKICYEIQSKHPRDFDQVLGLCGRSFSYDKNELRRPQKLEGTDIYVETNSDNNRKMKIITDMLNLFGYKPDSLQLELTDKKDKN